MPKKFQINEYSDKGINLGERHAHHFAFQLCVHFMDICVNKDCLERVFN